MRSFAAAGATTTAASTTIRASARMRDPSQHDLRPLTATVRASSLRSLGSAWEVGPVTIRRYASEDLGSSNSSRRLAIAANCLSSTQSSPPCPHPTERRSPTSPIRPRPARTACSTPLARTAARRRHWSPGAEKQRTRPGPRRQVDRLRLPVGGRSVRHLRDQSRRHRQTDHTHRKRLPPKLAHQTDCPTICVGMDRKEIHVNDNPKQVGRVQ